MADPARIAEATLAVADILLGITAVITEYNMVVGQARTEGRDLTEEELDSIREKRRAAYERLMSIN